MGILRYLERQTNIRRVQAATERQDNDLECYQAEVRRVLENAGRRDVADRAFGNESEE